MKVLVELEKEPRKENLINILRKGNQLLRSREGKIKTNDSAEKTSGKKTSKFARFRKMRMAKKF